MADTVRPTIDALLEQLCREHDLTSLGLEFRRNRDESTNDFSFNATAIWSGFTTREHPNCTEWGGSASSALERALEKARSLRQRSTRIVPQDIAA